MTKTNYNSAIELIKTEFRRWYGTVSIRELAANRALAFEIEILERMLAAKGQ